MGLFGWWSKKGGTDGTKAWRNRWAAAVSSLDHGAVAELEAALRASPPLADDLEIEDEMLDGLRQLLTLERELASGTPPLIETSHRVVGSDRCHFSAPVSIPDDPAQPTGRLLLTSSRAAFAGATRAPSLPWHAVRDVVQTGRDLLFVTSRGPEDAQRFRCNSYSEAMCGGAIARYLVNRARTRQI
jgi:hypothetical protein